MPVFRHNTIAFELIVSWLTEMSLHQRRTNLWAWIDTMGVHLIRSSLDYANWKDRKALAAALKPVYTAPSAEAAAAELDSFDEGEWGRRYSSVAAAWRRVWERVIPFYTFPQVVRKVVYSANALESVNAGLRKIIRTRRCHFPRGEAMMKLRWLVLRNITAGWTRARERSANAAAYGAWRCDGVLLTSVTRSGRRST